MSDEQHMICPGCGEDAVPQPPADLTPWQAHGLAVPEWSHPDRSSLCPVIGPTGYEPARPQAGDAGAAPEPGRGDREVRAARLEPPGITGGHDAQRAGHPQAGTAGAAGRAYMTRAITRLGEMHQQDQAEPEPEAGS
ncbi:MAG: hypothetical protein ACYCO9_16885 [Streptosporangiaceae bacterium]